MNFFSLHRSLSCGAIFFIFSLPVLARHGGGYTLGGLTGAYFTNAAFTGAPGFSRRDVRIDFGANILPPGGAGQAGDLAFRSLPAVGFSVRWTGQIVPRFSEPYSFRSISSGSFRLRIRPAGGENWITVIDEAAAEEATGTNALVAANAYDVEIAFAHATGPWSARLL